MNFQKIAIPVSWATSLKKCFQTLWEGQPSLDSKKHLRLAWAESYFTRQVGFVHTTPDVDRFSILDRSQIQSLSHAGAVRIQFAFSKLKKRTSTNVQITNRLDRCSDYVPGRTAVELRLELRSKSVSNKELAVFLNEVLDSVKWTDRRVAKYLGGERRFTYEVYLAICERFCIDPLAVSLRALESRKSVFEGSTLSKKIRKLVDMKS